MKQEQIFVAITLDNGRVAVMGFMTVGRGVRAPYGGKMLEKSPGWWEREATDENIFQEICRTSFANAIGKKGDPEPQPTKWRRISPSEIPADREYRNAISDDGKKLSHDMPRARELHLKKLRSARGPKLDQLDRDWMRATGQGNKKLAEEIEKRRQALRDVPQTLGVEKASTVEELKALKSPLLEE